ncbi:hypothetical protein [Kitasatospora sp. LaBMicrA B282]|uniref:hypothetical protein n=1 Tax=Kitasatospora sp. LaBMicrA B282 TaxID=3420949 RepID=UPI003D098FF9
MELGQSGPDLAAERIITAMGWQSGSIRTMPGFGPGQLRLVHDADRWWIGIDNAFNPYRRLRLFAGHVLHDGTTTDWTAVLDHRVDSTDTAALAAAVHDLRHRLDHPQP